MSIFQHCTTDTTFLPFFFFLANFPFPLSFSVLINKLLVSYVRQSSQMTVCASILMMVTSSKQCRAATKLGELLTLPYFHFEPHAETSYIPILHTAPDKDHNLPFSLLSLYQRGYRSFSSQLGTCSFFIRLSIQVAFQ